LAHIRKISIGSDYKNAMHYVVGQKVIGDSNEIHEINYNEQKESYRVYAINEKQEVTLWKEFSSRVPISIEYNIEF